MKSDGELLRAYAKDGDEAAFAELVRRYVDFVYSVARRLTNGDATLAQDVSQSVFTDLARKAWPLSERPTVSGWLHTSARYAAAKARRGESRRRAHEQEAFAMQDHPTTPEINWEQLRPLLDEAVGRLRARDRDIVTLRFFQNKTHREIGAELGLPEDTARKRVDRALEKLRGHFARRGITVSTALLMSAIAANSVQAAPAGLTTKLTGTALTGASSTRIAGTFFKLLYMTTKNKTVLLAALFAAVAAIPLYLQHQEISQLQDDQAAARKPQTALENLIAARAKAVEPVVTLAQLLKESGHNQVDLMRDALRYVDSIKPGEIGAALDALKKMPWPPMIRSIKSLLLARWADRDPAAALAWVRMGEDRAFSRQNDYVDIFQAWAAKDPAAALAGLSQIGDPNMRTNTENSLWNSITLADPQTALNLYHSLPLNQQSVNALGIIYYYWASTDPAAAEAAALNLPATTSRTWALLTIANAWAHQDPQTAFTYARSLPAGATRDDAMLEVMYNMAEQDPQTAASYLNQIPNNLSPTADGTSRNDLIDQIAGNLAQQNPIAALAWAANATTGQTYDKAVQSILAQMDQTDPASAAAFIAQMPDATTRDGAITQLATTWAQNDLPGAIAWAQSLPASEGDTRGEALKNVMQNWDDLDPTVAAGYIMQNLSNDLNFNVVAEQLVGHWAPSDPQSALAWAEALPSGLARDDSMVTALTDVALTNPQTAWTDAQQLSDGNDKQLTMAGIVQNWSTQNPVQAAAAYSQIPDGKPQVAAATALATAWASQDPTAASQWVNTLPTGDARDAAITQLISAEGRNSPSTAFNWALSISNSNNQQTQTENVVQLWAKQDPAAATAAVQAAPNLTDQQRANLLKTVQQAPSVVPQVNH